MNQVNQQNDVIHVSGAVHACPCVSDSVVDGATFHVSGAVHAFHCMSDSVVDDVTDTA